jgi:hypothetical protein
MRQPLSFSEINERNKKRRLTKIVLYGYFCLFHVFLYRNFKIVLQDAVFNDKIIMKTKEGILKNDKNGNNTSFELFVRGYKKRPVRNSAYQKRRAFRCENTQESASSFR